MTFWEKVKLVAGGLVAGLLLMLGIKLKRWSKPAPPDYDHLKDELDDMQQDHQDAVEEIQDKVKNKPLDEKLEEMNEKANDAAPWSGVHIHIPDNFRATKS